MTDSPAEVAEALACPFCGEVPTIANVRADENQGTKWGGVVCSCGIVGPEVRTGYEPVAKWADKAIREWNDQHAARRITELERQLAEARGELAAKDEAYRLQFEACAQLAAQRERDGRALKAIRQRLHCTSYRLGEDIIDIIDAALKDRP
jgi:hypothetical protein